MDAMQTESVAMKDEKQNSLHGPAVLQNASSAVKHRKVMLYCKKKKKEKKLKNPYLFCSNEQKRHI